MATPTLTRTKEPNAEGRAALCAANPLAWMLDTEAVTNKGVPMEWYDRFWMTSILTDMSPELVVKKCAQIGMSTVEIFKSLHACVHRTVNAIYTLPTDSDVNEFVSSKVNPIMRLNHIPTGGKDSIGEKIIGAGDRKSFLFFKGSFMERAGIMIDADYLVMDELDHCDQKTLETYKSRIEDSDMAWLHRFSTPSAPNKRIDREWKAGDMNYWFVTCPNCGNEWFMDWPESEGMYVDYERSIFACKKCEGEITDAARRGGRWVNKWSSEGKPRSYWVSGLMKVTHRSCADLIRKEKESQPWYFYNYVLGKTYAGSDVQITEGMITKNLSFERPKAENMSMGVDVGGHEHYYVIGNPKGIYEIGVIQYSESDTDKGYNRIYAKMKDYDVKTCVIDGNPCTNESQDFAKTFPYKVYLSYFKPQEQAPSPYYFDDSVQDKYVVIADRHRSLSWVIGEFQKGNIALFLDAHDPNMERYTGQWKNLYQQTVIKPDGTEKQEWTADDDPDHFALATTYYKIAVGRYQEWEQTAEPYNTTKIDEGDPLDGILRTEKSVDDYDWYYGPNETEY